MTEHIEHTEHAVTAASAAGIAAADSSAPEAAPASADTSAPEAASASADTSAPEAASAPAGTSAPKPASASAPKAAPASAGQQTRNQTLLGVLAVLITSVCYGLVPAFSFIAFGMGVETETLLFNKFLYASVIIWIFLLVRRIPFRFSRRAALGTAVTCIGYIAMSTTLYISFDYISGSLATIVSFTFPAMIVAIEMITRKEPVQLTRIAAVVLSFGGLVLIVWSPDIMGGQRIGIFFAFLAALCYVIYLFGLDFRSVREENSFAVAAYIMSAAAAVNFVRCLLAGKPLFAAAPAQIGMMLLLSVVCVFLSIIFYAIGVRLIGPGNAALVNTTEPVLACIFSHFLVGDLLTGRMLIGAGLVIAAVLITNLPSRPGSDGGS